MTLDPNRWRCPVYLLMIEDRAARTMAVVDSLSPELFALVQEFDLIHVVMGVKRVGEDPAAVRRFCVAQYARLQRQQLGAIAGLGAAMRQKMRA